MKTNCFFALGLIILLSNQVYGQTITKWEKVQSRQDSVKGINAVQRNELKNIKANSTGIFMLVGSTVSEREAVVGSISGQVKKTAYRANLGTVISKYIGETEKNIDKLFEELPHTAGIIFFDQADELFNRKTPVRESQDKYANQEIAYLVHKLEGYQGIVVIATSRKQAIDPAFLRRIRYVFEFPKPTTAH